MKNTICKFLWQFYEDSFWDQTLCSLLTVDQHFRGTCCQNLKCKRWKHQLPPKVCQILSEYIVSAVGITISATVYTSFGTWSGCSIYKDVSKSYRTVLVKRSLLTLDVKFLHHLQSTPPLHEYSGPSVSAMLGSIPASPFLELCQVPAAIHL